MILEEMITYDELYALGNEYRRERDEAREWARRVYKVYLFVGEMRKAEEAGRLKSHRELLDATKENAALRADLEAARRELAAMRERQPASLSHSDGNAEGARFEYTHTEPQVVRPKGWWIRIKPPASMED